MQQDQNIKGFTLLELLVVITIVGIVSAVGIPNFMSWNKDRVLRASTEKVVNMINSINTQSQRGSLPFVICMVIAIMILCFFPEIATWLPNYIMGEVL